MKSIPQISVLKIAKLVLKRRLPVLKSSLALNVSPCFYAASFLIKMYICETNNVFYPEYWTYFHKTVNCFWKFNNTFRNFVYFSSYLQTDFYMKVRLCNIFETANTIIMDKTILEIPYPVLQDSHKFKDCLMIVYF